MSHEYSETWLHLDKDLDAVIYIYIYAILCIICIKKCTVHMDRRLPQVIGKQAATIIEIREKLGDPEHRKKLGFSPAENGGLSIQK